jgi:hypothetical protein
MQEKKRFKIGYNIGGRRGHEWNFSCIFLLLKVPHTISSDTLAANFTKLFFFDANAPANKLECLLVDSLN